MNELLLELFCEEIPARMQEKAASQILSLLLEKISNLNIKFSKSKCFVTPRRLTFYVSGLPREIPASVIERKGPKIDAKEEAIKGFLNSVNMQLKDLEIIDNCYYAKKIEPARPIEEFLESSIEQILISFTWPKSMRIGDASSRNRWVRPIRNILCLFNGNILGISFAGLKANNQTFGHRFMAPEVHNIASFEDYKNVMKNSFVVLDSEDRKNIIISDAQKIADSLNLNLVIDQSLINEVTGLVEYPNVLLGKIDKEFTNLPKEVLVSVMKNHQRYFYLLDSDGNIAPYFIFVANVKRQDDSLIIAGNEKVLRARFADAKFFWEKDLQLPISESLAKLAKMTFHHKLGSMFDKVTRIIALATYIAESIKVSNIEPIKTAALLCKTDLVSEMVGEFPELQGIMGGYYAKHAGENETVSLAIAEHYRPAESEDKGDISELSALIAISDKIDSIVGLWIAGEKPTSSKDPFALRRAALGIIKLIRYHKFSLSLKDLILNSLSQYEMEYPSEIIDEIIIFFNDRLKYYLKAENIRHDLIIAVLNETSDNIFLAINNLHKIEEYMKKEEAKTLVFAMKRILNILSNSKDNLEGKVDLKQFKQTEQNLYDKLIKLSSIKSCEELQELVPFIDKFFEEILVNDANENLRKNRLILLNMVATLSKQVADFNFIEA